MRHRSFLVAVLLCLLSTAGLSQIDQSGFVSATSLQITTTNYYFAKPNELTIVVSVVGYVQRPGRYEISKSIDLINLIALAGGATPDGTLGDVRITRFAQIGGTVQMRDVHLDLDDLSHLTPNELALYPGDIVRISRSTWATVRDVFTVVGYAALITGAAAQVVIATNR